MSIAAHLSYSLSLSFFLHTMVCYSTSSITSLSQVHWLRRRSLLNPTKILDDRQSLPFPGKRRHAIVPGLEPFSEYRLTVSVFNKKGNGPNSDPVTFNTPEGGEVLLTTHTMQHTTNWCFSHTRI